MSHPEGRVIHTVGVAGSSTKGVVVDGESGTDTYTYDFSAAGQVGIDLTPINGGLILQIAGGAGQLFPWASIEAVDLTMNDGANAVSTFAFGGTARVLGNGGNDTLTGGSAVDLLSGGSGNDTIDGGGAADRVEAGDGDDVVRAADGSADSVDCGGATDIAVADPTDVLAACETVTKPVPPDTTKPVPTIKAAKLKGSAVKVPVLCPVTELRCVGSVNLKATGKKAGKRMTIALGKGLVVADGGRRVTVVVKVDGATKRTLTKLTKPQLKVAYDLMDVVGNVAKGTVKVKLKIP